MARVAVTGASGFVGSNIAAVLRASGHEVVGLRRADGASATGSAAPGGAAPGGAATGDGGPEHWRAVDYSSVEAIAQQLADTDAVVHCAIANDFNRLLENRTFAYDSYVGLTQRVALAATLVNSKLVYISTDWVVDGQTHLTPESDPGNPINFYGFLKAMSEQVVRDLAPRGAVCRIAGVMGRHQLQAEGPRQQDVGFGYFVYSLVQALEAGRQFAVWGGPNVNQITTPSLATEIGAQVGRVIQRDATGTLHLVGDDAVSRLELADAVCAAFELDRGLITESLPPESELFPAPVPRDSSLRNLATKDELGLGPTPLAALLAAFRAELASGQPRWITQG